MDTSTPTQDYPALFLTALNHLFKAEGGYVDDALDAGGETKFGISQRAFPQLNIRALTKADAVRIYYQHYWLAYQCDQFPPAIAGFLFDAVVNHRPKVAVRFLQVQLQCIADGIVGPSTIGWTRQYCISPDRTQDLLIRLFAQRADFYHDLVQDQPSQARFLMGWLRRLFSLHNHLLSEADYGLAQQSI